MLMELCQRSSLRYAAKKCGAWKAERRESEREIKRESWKEMNERVKEKRNGREKGRKFFSRSKVSFHVICRALESR